MAEKIKLTIAEQIDRAREGRSQTYIVEKMVDAGVKITEVIFSRKKLGRAEDSFTNDELKTISQILGTTIEG